MSREASVALSRLLRAGVWTGTALLVTGSVLGIAAGELRPGLGLGEPGLQSLRSGFRMDAETILRAGLLLIIATPLARVVVAGVLLGRKRDRAAVACTIAVLALLAIAVALDLRHV